MTRCIGSVTAVCVSGKQCSGYGQCVERAECSSDTYGLCVCERGYFNKNGRCASLAQPGSPCTGKEQCVPNTICFKTCICQVTMETNLLLWGGGGDGIIVSVTSASRPACVR